MQQTSAQEDTLLPFPLILNNRHIADVEVKIDDQEILLNRQQFTSALFVNIIPEKTLDLRALTSKWINIDQLTAYGLDIHLDLSTLEIQMDTPSDDIPVKKISIQQKAEPISSSYNLLEPAETNFFVNLSLRSRDRITHDSFFGLMV